MKNVIITIVFFLFAISISSSVEIKFRNMTAEDFASYQTDIMQEKLNLSESNLKLLSDLNLNYTKQYYKLTLEAKSYSATKKTFYSLFEVKRLEALKFIPEENKGMYNSIEDKFKIIIWNEIKKSLRSRDIK